MIEIHRSFVNTWECDENRHMNVRFYLRRFEEGAAVFLAMRANGGKRPVLRHRHVRYHRELLEAESTVTLAAFPQDGPLKGHLVQVLREISTGRICATSLDRFEGLETEAIEADDEATEAVSPRGLAAGDCEADDPAILTGYMETGAALAISYIVVKQDDLDAEGRPRTDRIVGCFSDGASHIWEHAGITTEWLNAHNNGRVSVEMKVQPASTASPGEVLQLVSRVGDHRGRTFRLVHTLRSLDDGRAVARGEVCCLVMNLESRRAVPLPESFAAYMIGHSL